MANPQQSTKPQVWILDRNPIHRTLLVGLLQKKQYETVVASHSEILSALNINNRETDQTLIVDIDENKPEDIDLIHTIQNAYPTIRLIGLSSAQATSSFNFSKLAAILDKPVHAALLLTAIKHQPSPTDPELVSPVNIDGIMTRVCGQTFILQKIVAQFSQQLPEQIAELDLAIENQSAEDVRRAAHAIKGAVANFDAAKAQDLAFALETMGSDNQLTGAPKAFAELQLALTAVENALIELIDTNRKP